MTRAAQAAGARAARRHAVPPNFTAPTTPTSSRACRKVAQARSGRRALLPQREWPTALILRLFQADRIHPQEEAHYHAGQRLAGLRLLR